MMSSDVLATVRVAALLLPLGAGVSHAATPSSGTVSISFSHGTDTNASAALTPDHAPDGLTGNGSYRLVGSEDCGSSP